MLRTMSNIMKEAGKDIAGTAARTAVAYGTAKFLETYAVACGAMHVVGVAGRAVCDCGIIVADRIERATREDYWRKVEEL